MVRDWRRRLFGGMGMAIIVPGMLLASLAVLAIAGGFGGLNALGQAFSGPPAPAAALTGGHGAATAHALPARLVAALSATPVSASAPGNGSRGAPVPSTPVSVVAPGPLVPTSPPPGGGRSRGGPAPAGGRSRAPSPPSQPQPTVVDRVVGAGTSVTAQFPGPVGSTATSALRSAGATLDSVAPVKSVKLP